MNLPSDISQRIQNAARDLEFARSAVARAQTWEEQQSANRRFEECEQAMVEAANAVNRGLPVGA